MDRFWQILKSTKIGYLVFVLLLMICQGFTTGNVQDMSSEPRPEQQRSSTKQERPDETFRKKLIANIAKAETSFGDRFDAEVWLFEQAKRLSKAAPHIPENERFKILRLVHQEATRFNLDPLLVLALIDVESDFDRYAISSAGALGLMQVMPFWKAEIGHPDDNLNDIHTNIRYGCAILSLYLEKDNQDKTLALARYNGSRGKYWYPMRVYKAMRKIWHP